MHICSWSGGKDSALACFRAIKSGCRIAGLVNLISEDHKRVRFHGTEAALIRCQAELAGLRLLQGETSDKDYEGGFKKAAGTFLPHIKGMVFGDIYVDEHRQWVERVCGEMGIEAIEPLWKEDTGKLMREFLDSGFEAVIVSGMKEFIDREWIGRKIDDGFLKYLKGRPDADLCGEKGEYHTFVTAGPLFKGRIEITESEVIERDGYWFLDTKEYGIVK